MKLAGGKRCQSNQLIIQTTRLKCHQEQSNISLPIYFQRRFGSWSDAAGAFPEFRSHRGAASAGTSRCPIANLLPKEIELESGEIRLGFMEEARRRRRRGRRRRHQRR